EEVKRMLHPPDRHGAVRIPAHPGAPARDGNQDIEDRPDRAKQPSWRGEDRLVQRIVPFARRGLHADEPATADDEYEEQNERKNAFHVTPSNASSGRTEPGSHGSCQAFRCSAEKKKPSVAVRAGLSVTPCTPNRA